MVDFSESAREREFFRWVLPASKVTATADRDLIYSTYDPALLAFAQVGMLQLNTQRCVISLIGAQAEHILAEAGNTISIYGAVRKDEGEAAWHSEAVLKDRADLSLWALDSLCGFSEQPSLPLVEVNLLDNEKWKNLTLTKEAPFSRSYVSFPLLTGRGYIIGLLTLIDDKPRAPLESSEIDFLKHVASTAMNHIEAGRVKQSHARSEKMVKAMAVFLEGGESLREWWLDQALTGSNAQQSKVNDRSRGGVTLPQQADVEFGVQDGPDNASQATIQGLQSELDHSLFAKDVPSSDYIDDDDRRGDFSKSELASTNSTMPSQFIGKDDSTVSEIQSDGVPELPSNLATFGASRGYTYENTSVTSEFTPGKELQEALLSDDVKKTFGRASNLLREALDIDGVVFFDATVGKFGVGSTMAGINPTAPGRHNVDLVPTSTTSESDISRHSAGTSIPNETEGGGSIASVLAYSTRTRSSLKSHATSDEIGQCPDALLQALCKRYPYGKIFNFTDKGTLSSSDHDESSDGILEELSAQSQSRRARKRENLRWEEKTIFEILKGVRSVAWFPLWNAGSERWYAGAFIISASNARVLTAEEDIIHMAAWGNSIMAEIGRLSALVASQMKVDFVASISHELRSPLHGILASVEFLQDGHLSVMQAEMVTTINSCGRTLLDTINHVLEFAKFKKDKKSNKSNKSKRKTATRPHVRGNIKSTNVSVTTGEVIDSVYAGRILTKPPPPEGVLTAPVIVIVDISWEPNWNLQIDTGAYRRVLMNLLSNALKYTEEGYVKVALTLDHKSSTPEGKSLPYVNLEISDSGRGISREFLRDHLYTPFQQENTLSVGTGLGLSIVRQIVHDVKGTIEIESELSLGTKATVSIPVLMQKIKDPLREDRVSKIRSAMESLRVCLLVQSFHIFPDMSYAPTGIPSLEAEGMLLLKASVKSMFSDWFNVEVEETSALDIDHPNLIVMRGTTELDATIRTVESSPQETRCSRIIVICHASHQVNNFVTDGGTKVYHLWLPASPHKLGNILRDMFSEKPSSSDNRGNHPNQPLGPSAKSNPLQVEFARTVSVQRPLEMRRSSSETLTSAHVPEKSNVKSAGTSSSTQQWTVLLVEDNPINLNLLIMNMKKLGHKYVTATNGLEAVAAYKLAREEIKIVFMDIHMPFMDGVESTRQMRLYEHNEGLPPVAIVALTGAVSPNAKQEAFTSGMDLYLTKPVAMHLLKEVLQAFKDKGRTALKSFM